MPCDGSPDRIPACKESECVRALRSRRKLGARISIGGSPKRRLPIMRSAGSCSRGASATRRPKPRLPRTTEPEGPCTAASNRRATHRTVQFPVQFPLCHQRLIGADTTTTGRPMCLVPRRCAGRPSDRQWLSVLGTRRAQLNPTEARLRVCCHMHMHMRMAAAYLRSLRGSVLVSLPNVNRSRTLTGWAAL